MTAYAGLAKTQAGRTRQLTRAYRGMAHEMEIKQAAVACDDLDALTPQELRSLVRSLQAELAEVQRPAAAPAAYWDTRRVARESHVAICTICRNADKLGGIKLGGEWLFPAGTTYGRRRKSK